MIKINHVLGMHTHWDPHEKYLVPVDCDAHTSDIKLYFPLTECKYYHQK